MMITIVQAFPGTYLESINDFVWFMACTHSFLKILVWIPSYRVYPLVGEDLQGQRSRVC